MSGNASSCLSFITHVWTVVCKNDLRSAEQSSLSPDWRSHPTSTLTLWSLFVHCYSHVPLPFTLPKTGATCKWCLCRNILTTLRWKVLCIRVPRSLTDDWKQKINPLKSNFNCELWCNCWRWRRARWSGVNKEWQHDNVLMTSEAFGVVLVEGD